MYVYKIEKFLDQTYSFAEVKKKCMKKLKSEIYNFFRRFFNFPLDNWEQLH